MASLFHTLCAIAAVTILAACGLKKDQEAATKSVETFHQQFNDMMFAEIYSAASDGFKASGKEADILKSMQEAYSHLGAYKSGTQDRWSTNATTNGTFVVLTCSSQFEKGTAVESFTFVISGESAMLQRYKLSSPVITK